MLLFPGSGWHIGRPAAPPSLSCTTRILFERRPSSNRIFARSKVPEWRLPQLAEADRYRAASPPRWPWVYAANLAAPALVPSHRHSRNVHRCVPAPTLVREIARLMRGKTSKVSGAFESSSKEHRLASQKYGSRFRGFAAAQIQLNQKSTNLSLEYRMDRLLFAGEDLLHLANFSASNHVQVAVVDRAAGHGAGAVVVGHKREIERLSSLRIQIIGTLLGSGDRLPEPVDLAVVFQQLFLGHVDGHVELGCLGAQLGLLFEHV